jgi:hypothetical protein
MTAFDFDRSNLMRNSKNAPEKPINIKNKGEPLLVIAIHVIARNRGTLIQI